MALSAGGGNKDKYRHINQLVINLDNGPHNSSHRTQFMKRLTEFADTHDLEIVLAYYPPYHSKYNPIERCWGILENYWSGTLLNTLETTLEWAKTMTWKGLLLETVYKKGVKIAKKAFQSFADRITRHPSLPKYGVTLKPRGDDEGGIFASCLSKGHGRCLVFCHPMLLQNTTYPQVMQAKMVSGLLQTVTTAGSNSLDMENGWRRPRQKNKIPSAFQRLC